MRQIMRVLMQQLGEGHVRLIDLDARHVPAAVSAEDAEFSLLCASGKIRIDINDRNFVKITVQRGDRVFKVRFLILFSVN